MPPPCKKTAKAAVLLVAASMARGAGAVDPVVVPVPALDLLQSPPGMLQEYAAAATTSWSTVLTGILVVSLLAKV